MTTHEYDCTTLADDTLAKQLHHFAAAERGHLAAFLARLAEVDARKLFAKLGFTSMFKYLTQELGFAEGSACKRIQIARRARTFPIIFSLIEQGKIHMEAVSLLSPILTEANHQDVLSQACGKTTHDVERLVVRLAPKPDVPDRVRKLPAQRRQSTFVDECAASGTEAAQVSQTVDTALLLPPSPARRDQVKPLAPERFKIQFTGSDQLQSKLQRAKELLRHACPSGRLEDIFEAALDALLDKKDPERRIALKQKRHYQKRQTNKRTIPQSIKDQVWRRDCGRCTFVSPNGHRCGEKGGLEYDHIQPWALGGGSEDPGNIRLLCRTHNQLQARAVFGERNFSQPADII